MTLDRRHGLRWPDPRLPLSSPSRTRRAGAFAENVPMTADHWDVAGETASSSRTGGKPFASAPAPGRPARGAEANLRGADLHRRDRRVRSAAPGGLRFPRPRLPPAGRWQWRPVLHSPTPERESDSTQYTPVVNGSLAWQIFTGDGFTSQHRFNYGHWMHVRADIYANSALITIDGTPALVIPHLKSRSHSGALGLTSVHGAYFANFTATPIADYRDPNPAPRRPHCPRAPSPPGRFRRRSPRPTPTVRAARADWSGIQWQRIDGRKPRRGQICRSPAPTGTATTATSRASRYAAPPPTARRWSSASATG